MIDLETAGRTHRGRVRSRNEDAWADRPDLGLVAVADGMGGHPAGDVASRLAIETLVDVVESAASEPRERERETSGGPMAEAVRRAHERILADGREHPSRRGMGTTLTALQVLDDAPRYRVGHVGDSRAYRFRDGELDPLTRDDTALQEEVDAGRLTREEARVHPMGHVLSQALGTTESPEPQVASGSPGPNDLFLLCSDGLTAVLSEDRIREILSEGAEEPLEAVADRLVDATLEGGAPDNVTVALLRISGRGAAGGESDRT